MPSAETARPTALDDEGRARKRPSADSFIFVSSNPTCFSRPSPSFTRARFPHCALPRRPHASRHVSQGRAARGQQSNDDALRAKALPLPVSLLASHFRISNCPSPVPSRFSLEPRFPPAAPSRTTPPPPSYPPCPSWTRGAGPAIQSQARPWPRFVYFPLTLSSNITTPRLAPLFAPHFAPLPQRHSRTLSKSSCVRFARASRFSKFKRGGCAFEREPTPLPSSSIHWPWRFPPGTSCAPGS